MGRRITMKKQVKDYLNYRRSLGFQLKSEERVLINFANYAENKDHKGHLTIKLAVEWALSSKSKKNLTHARRMEVLRPFAQYCSISNSRTEIPGTKMFGKAHRRQTPYIFSNHEISHLLSATRFLIPQDGLRPISFRYLFSLLYTTGLRVSEALNLKITDIDWKNGVLKINQTKFKKSRLVPLHITTINALSDYCKIRNEYEATQYSNQLFVIDKGNPITYRAIQYAFLKLRQLLHWDKKDGKKQPRIYDLRHTFVCNRLLAWYKDGIDVFAVIPYLSTYLGHIKLSDTYWYITGLPQLMNIAGERFYSYINSIQGGNNETKI